MRFSILLSAFLLVACRREEEPSAANQVASPAPAAGSSISTYAGQGRDRLCLDEQSRRAGLITYGQGDSNCSVRGGLQRSGERLTIVPDGEQACRVDATLRAGQVTLGALRPECSYYCGPTADLSGRTFRIAEGASPATDLAGEPLC